MERYFTDQETTVEELENFKWEVMSKTEDKLENALYALYLQQQIDEVMTGVEWLVELEIE